MIRHTSALPSNWPEFWGCIRACDALHVKVSEKPIRIDKNMKAAVCRAENEERFGMSTLGGNPREGEHEECGSTVGVSSWDCE